MRLIHRNKRVANQVLAEIASQIVDSLHSNARRMRCSSGIESMLVLNDMLDVHLGDYSVGSRCPVSCMWPLTLDCT